MDIKKNILEFARENKSIKVSNLVKQLNDKYSRQYIARIVRALVDEGKLLKGGSTNHATYVLPENAVFLGKSLQKHYHNKNLKEHEILDEISHHALFIDKLPENIRSIFVYAFTEMLNNAIEHSRSGQINIQVTQAKKYLTFLIRDFGIGVFKNVQKKRKLKSELEAIQDLLKGKTTTAPKAHSGEGIFFTLKIADLFMLESFGLRLRIDNTIPDIFVEEIKKPLKGTEVSFNIDITAKKHLSDIFRKFQTDLEDLAFDKTEIQIKLYAMGTVYVSRSQARRVLTGLDKFKLVILDFDKVPTVGQAFADEIFRVFKIKYPQIIIKPINMNEAVNFMVGRVAKHDL